MGEVINAKLFERQTETVAQAAKMLRREGKCAVLRPTGFGKTTVMCKLAVSNYKNILYIYPSDIIKTSVTEKMDQYIAESHRDITPKYQLLSYTKVGKYHDNPDELLELIKKFNFDLIIFDEIHHMGANFAKETVSSIIAKIDLRKTHILGATATPKRMDGYDVVDNFFDNCVVQYYGMSDAIDDGIIPKPYYVYSLYGTASIVKSLSSKCKGYCDLLKIIAKDELRRVVSKIQPLVNPSNIIRNTVDEVYKNETPDYMRFLVFFQKDDMIGPGKPSEHVEKWFRDAFNNLGYTVRSTKVTYSNSKKGLDDLNKLGSPSKTIDLVMSINMLNEGYHVDNITGVVLLRPTQSHTVYTQQVGRSLQVNIDYTPIILDFVSNLSIKNIFNKTEKESKNTGNLMKNQLEHLNDLDVDHVIINDTTAKLLKITRKIDADLPSDVENRVLLLRTMKDIPWPADAIAKKLGISVWEVHKILDKYEDQLRPLGLHKQEGDFYKQGNTPRFIGDKAEKVV